ncbi:hypothetical protein PENARI_c005G11795 [Penicillium arizonense]|uniref:Zn(2)-C6 fungal-type domain-containing protein n=1 Tax=Penicillium arizonense TaxID=1835702 RepID=A0A1F5LP36_PENAI|nr:hypothetical protein PENARI_c005G11795 [Penicillium arizonense]OGE54968.1 hypothetical protein PENARI_c005G11795 [Penicillium arizonense]
MDSLYRKPRRGTVACTVCRARKVRCDVSRGGAPCTNCALDARDCYVISKPLVHSQNNKRILKTFKPRSSVPEKETVCPPRSPITSGENSDYSLSINSPETNIDPTPPTLQQLLLDRPSESLDSESEQSDTLDTFFSTYGFIRTDFMLRLPQEDIRYLETQKCLRLPGKPIFDEFMRNYFFHVHPLLPLLNESKIWEMCKAQQPSTPHAPVSSLSLFTLQAILFATCSFVTPKSLRMVGFKSVQHAHERLYRHCQTRFQRVKVVFFCLSDPSITQEYVRRHSGLAQQFSMRAGPELMTILTRSI